MKSEEWDSSSSLAPALTEEVSGSSKWTKTIWRDIQKKGHDKSLCQLPQLLCQCHSEELAQPTLLGQHVWFSWSSCAALKQTGVVSWLFPVWHESHYPSCHLPSGVQRNQMFVSSGALFAIKSITWHRWTWILAHRPLISSSIYPRFEVSIWPT